MKKQYEKYYFNNPELWDSIRKKSFTQEVRFLDRLFKQEGSVRKVLDVGCGTGLHAAALSKLGYEVVGVDANRRMVEFAAAKYPGLDFICGEMKDFLIEGKTFDAIFCLCTVFSYNTTNSDVITTLHNFYNHLRPGGLLIIDNINPISLIGSRAFKDEIIEFEPYSEYGLFSQASHLIKNREQVLEEVRTIKEVSSETAIHSDVTNFRLFFPKEFEFYLEYSGFQNMFIRSDFKATEDDDSLSGYRMISLAKKYVR
ncbi:MAG TPA: class I SAM-dependent methyltransferase [Candidatus Paceibacterota bacterium]|nr:class I SAM-dependent methyltransferase [Candidatus Paceibacterota bacterium]